MWSFRGKDGERDRALMRALDAVKARWGRGSLQYASAGLDRPWAMRQARLSRRYATAWDELPTARA